MSISLANFSPLELRCSRPKHGEKYKEQKLGWGMGSLRRGLRGAGGGWGAMKEWGKSDSFKLSVVNARDAAHRDRQDVPPHRCPHALSPYILHRFQGGLLALSISGTHGSFLWEHPAYRRCPAGWAPSSLSYGQPSPEMKIRCLVWISQELHKASICLQPASACPLPARSLARVITVFLPA